MTPKTLDQGLTSEWLYTNGLGGYASSTLAGCNTRRYHALLAAALQPPVKRTLLVSKLDETLFVGQIPFELATNEFEDGAIHPDGWKYLARFERPLGIPTFTFAFQGWRLEKKVWMEQAQNTTFVQYLLQAAPSACQLRLRPFYTYRDFHAEQHGGSNFDVSTNQDGSVTVEAFSSAEPCVLSCDHPAGFEEGSDWWWRFGHRAERERGLDWTEDLFTPGQLSIALLPEQPVLFRFSIEPQPAPFAGAIQRAEDHGRQSFATPAPAEQGDNVASQLRFAASQFVVRRGTGASVIAGYHWFQDWGRDTMIALPGLALETGRPELALDILRTFAAFVDRGMIPNRFSEESGGAEYNNVDGTLWFFQAVDRYLRGAEDTSFLGEVFPTLESVVDWHLRGTRFNIKVDTDDGLLFSGEEGVQLTWMDAKVGDWIVTTRIGKPVEVNALWFNAICLMAAWARELEKPAEHYQQLARQIGLSFRERFWYAEGGYLYDVIDGP
ncbi:MAG TPA: glycogen debranching enzyme N-terminal domain-containing protein, partial [Chloroflexota bacterium]|nr:glycogen debranching enzyme N-terminal domain-containing protein [Chloroflexota bacterium]